MEVYLSSIAMFPLKYLIKLLNLRALTLITCRTSATPISSLVAQESAQGTNSRLCGILELLSSKLFSIVFSSENLPTSLVLSIAHFHWALFGYFFYRWIFMIITYIVHVPNRALRTTSELLRSCAIFLKAKWDILYPVSLKFTNSLGNRRTKPSRQELDAGFHENWVKAFPLLLICFDGCLGMSRVINLESGFLTSLKYLHAACCLISLLISWSVTKVVFLRDMPKQTLVIIPLEFRETSVIFPGNDHTLTVTSMRSIVYTFSFSSAKISNKSQLHVRYP